MIDDASLVALQRSLNEYREAKRKIRIRLAEIEAEAEMLRSQLAMQETMIEQSELMLRRMLLPTDTPALSPGPPSASYAPPVRYPEPTLRPAASAAEIEAEVAKIRQHEKKSNVRFNDFRIPQAATIVLREAQGPLHVSEIYRRMAEGGFEFRGQHQLITLAVSLSRSKRFRKVAPGTFELNPNDHSAHSDVDDADAFPRTNAANSPT
ncbi:MAG: hypothetical protein SF339_02790 [Blastocatellia bacterium]|nr:hypothetical protein [Blastocatellia bacterium]